MLEDVFSKESMPTIRKQKIKFRLLQGMVRMLLIITLDLVWHNRAPCLFSVCDKTKHANKMFNLKKNPVTALFTAQCGCS